ncbi:zinc transporter ZntB [Marinobacterium sp. D7]|uniref:zinc transporter ZntB n=1 Tax=Marinobacterium ramblicola TaxID=2849041 RepID=UPI001C2DABC1|nr:zinc transporter ZntB [Marinobacterium ramblicola]MBV1789766.1 zinc transporter ZntB [Marinobacterium ramblicola]
MTHPENPLHALLLDGTGGARDLSGAEIQAWTPEQGILWLHLDYTDPSAQHWLLHDSELPELITEALLTENTRPRATQIGDGLLIALRGVNLNPGADPDDMVSVRLYVTPKLIVSTRKRRLQSITNLAADCRAGNAPQDTAEFLIELSDRLVMRMGDVVEETEETLSALELDILEQHDTTLRQSLAGLRRQTIRLRRYFGPQRDAFNQLQSERLTWISAEQKLLLREISDRLLRHIEDLDMIRERAAMAQEELISQLSDQLNQRMYILSLIAAIFLPLGFLTGLLGINVGGIPGADTPYAFGLFSIFLCILVAGQIWLFRRRRWL